MVSESGDRLFSTDVISVFHRSNTFYLEYQRLQDARIGLTSYRTGNGNRPVSHVKGKISDSRFCQIAFQARSKPERNLPVLCSIGGEQGQASACGQAHNTPEGM